MERRAVLCALGVSLSGCSGEIANFARPNRDEGSTEGSAETSTEAPTPTPTETSTEAPTPTPTEAPTPTPTEAPTPTPSRPEIVVGISSWAGVQTRGSKLELRVTRFLIRDELPRVGTPSSGYRWVDVYVQLRNRGTEPLPLSYRQWSFVDIRDERHGPDSDAMSDVPDTMPEEWTLRPLDGLQSRIVFEIENPRPAEFVVEPYQNADRPTVRIVTD